MMQQPPNAIPQYPQFQQSPPQQWQQQPNYAQPQTYYPPSQSPYGTPPIQNGIPPYGNPTYYQPGYGFVPPQIPSRSVGQSIKALPKQYMNVVNHPSTIAFFQEISKANWLMIWLQLGIMILAYIILDSIGILSFITVPLSFFFGQIFQYLLAEAFNGQGTFLAQSYTALLFHVPLNITVNYMNTFLDFIPIFGFNLSPLVYLMWLVYSIILNALQIKAVHSLTMGKAIAVVLIPSFLNLCLLSVAVLALSTAPR